MNPTELFFGLLLAGVLIALAGFYAWRQKGVLNRLRADPDLSPEDRGFFRAQVNRRLLCSALMVLFAGMLVGWFFLQNAVARAPLPEGPENQEEAKDALRLITGYWIVALVILFGIISLAAFDLWAIARFGLRQHRQLENERRAMLEEHARQYRQGGNGRKPE